MAFQEFTGREYLKIDVASNFGLDKALWSERIAWFDQHEHELEEHLTDAKEPALYYAGVKAWRDVQQGKPIGYMISLDATSSGLQLLAALTGDRGAGQLCNVVDTGRREDAYTAIYQKMLEQLGETAQITREDTKQAIMTAFYSSKAVPKRVFGEGHLLDLFYDTITRLAPGAWELNEAFEAMWDSNALVNSWVLPDNFHVHVKVMSQLLDTVHFLNAPYEVTYKVNAPQDEGRSLGANTIHSVDALVVRELTRRCMYDPDNIATLRHILTLPGGTATSRADDRMVVTLWDHYKASGFLSARILDHLTPQNLGHVEASVVLELIDTLPAKPFTVVSIHDCFRVLPHYANDLRRQYNLQLQLIAKSNLLSYLVSQILKRPVSIGKLDGGLWKQVADTNYALS